MEQWPDRFVTPPDAYQRASYPRLSSVLTGNATRALVALKNLAQPGNKTARHDRKKFEKTLRNFANVEAIQIGPDQSDIKSHVTVTHAKTDAIDQLRDLYTVLCQTCQCPLPMADNNFRTNLALDSRTSFKRPEEGLKVEMFILHRHSVCSQKRDTWKEVCLNVSDERSVSSIRPHDRPSLILRVSWSLGAFRSG